MRHLPFFDAGRFTGAVRWRACKTFVKTAIPFVPPAPMAYISVHNGTSLKANTTDRPADRTARTVNASAPPDGMVLKGVQTFER
jgi:hypothetical protein